MNTWTVDPTHSEVEFKVKHLMITNVKGFFRDFDLEVNTEEENFDHPKIKFTAKTASIDTGNEQRDQHLRSPEFFDSEKYPEMKFEAISFVKKEEGEYELTGNLTIKEITHPITLEVEYGGIMKDPWGNFKAGFSVKGKMNRKDWGLNWNASLETGGVLVSDEVKINAEIQLVRQAVRQAS